MVFNWGTLFTKCIPPFILLQLYAEPSDKTCRVEGCRQYGKNVKAFLGHLETHKLTWNQHRQLPPATMARKYVLAKTTKAWMKSRTPEICFVPGCEDEHKVWQTDIIKHLRKMHKLSREEYRNQMWVLLSKRLLPFFYSNCLCFENLVINVSI